VVIAHANKGLGSVGIELPKYICWALDEHLLDKTRYSIIPEEQALRDASTLYKNIATWLSKYSAILSANAKKFIKKKLGETINNPFGYFYLTFTLHKSPVSTHPVCSGCASLPQALRQWIDEQLQPIVKEQSTYFKNSAELKKELNKLTLPPNALLFTYNAVSMYTNVNTENCIAYIKEYLLQPATHYRFAPKIPRAIVEAMSLVMRNNRMHFGDLVTHQIKGIVMGMMPAPTIANLFVAIFKAEPIAPIIGTFIMFLHQFIINGFGIWIHDPDPTVNNNNWRLFQMIVNAMGLAWDGSSQAEARRSPSWTSTSRLKTEGLSHHST
jgi:hypothetical protein